MLLTPNQLKVLDFVSLYIKKNRYAPTIREIAKHHGCVHSNIWRILKDIETKGYVKIHKGKMRGLEVTNHGNSIQE